MILFVVKNRLFVTKRDDIYYEIEQPIYYGWNEKNS